MFVISGSQSLQVVVQTLPMLVSIPASRNGCGEGESGALDVGCGSRHTVVLTKDNNLWAFGKKYLPSVFLSLSYLLFYTWTGWNKYGQLGLGHTISRDTVEKIALPKSIGRNTVVKMLRCGDWGTAVVVNNSAKKA
jgi:alpha-tubulin suppressor-like RCC1 family protein